MNKWKTDSEIIIKKIAEKYKIETSIIDRVVYEWVDNLHFFENQEGWDPEPKDIASRTIEWAELSVFYHKNKSVIESDEPLYFRQSVFRPAIRKLKSLTFSRYHTNQIIKTYLKMLKRNKQVLDLISAEQIIKNNKSRKKQYIKPSNHNSLIIPAAFYLKSKNFKSYAQIISDLLLELGIASVKPGTIRQIIKRSKS